MMPRGGGGGGGDPMVFFLFVMKVALVCAVFWSHCKVQAFAPVTAPVGISSQSSVSQPSVRVGRNSCPLFASPSGRVAGGGGGMGMGGPVGGATKSKKKGAKGQNSNNSKISTTPFDVNASLLRMEKKYDELNRELAKQLLKEGDDGDDDVGAASKKDEMMISEYVIAARAASSKRSVLPDWVPIAQLCLKRPESEYHEGAADAMVRTAISTCCRELSHVAVVGAPVFATVARNEIQYSVESVGSFRKFVYDDVMEGNARQNPDETMTKATARQSLGLVADTPEGGSATADITRADIKQAYRKLSFELHPDRFVGTPEECEAAKERFGKVQLAYETLTSGVRSGDGGMSWYESLGGRARTGFVGPVELMPVAAAQEHLQRHNAEIAIASLDPSLIQSFVARNLRSE